MFPVEVSVSEVPLGNRLMFTCILRDITERKHAEEQARKWTERLEQRVRERTVELEHANQQLEGAVELAREASRAKDAFLATMSHELRTPLNAIIGYCEFMLEDPESLDTAELTGDLRKILASGRHLLALINDILDLAKIEAGKLKLDVTTFDLKPVINEIQDLMVPLVRAKGNTFKVEYPPALKAMRSDRLRVRQVLLNLLSNANKFTDKGAILLSILSDNDTDREWVTMRVSDTGKGMSAEDMKKLFTPFFQVDSTSTRKHEGTGLGLAISRRFANLMGGDIQVQSRLGEGSTFIVRIPLQVAPGEPRSAARVRHEPNGAAQPLETVQNSVLVIDDDPAVRELMERFLTKEGFRVVTAASGEEGLRLVKQVRPAAITLDAMMPGIDGWAVLAALKSDPATANIPIIMATIVDDQTRGFALGATDYLTKPIDWNRLSSLLKHQLRGRAGPVLVVEDEAHSRELMVRTLRREGWDVEEAENGRVALERFATKKPALILLDLMMPEMDGFQFVAALRLLPSGGDVPIIVVTARDLSDDDRRRLNGSVSQVLQKGTHTPDELLAEIHLRVTQLLTPAS
jgi:signal transduction histidine kinase/CheY-like chemotaxis protein